MLIDNITSVFFNDDIAVEATYTPAGGLPSTNSVIFDRDYIEANQFGNIGYETKEIWVTVKTDDYVDCKQGETIKINNITYYIINPQMDIGISRIKLSLNQPW